MQQSSQFSQSHSIPVDVMMPTFQILFKYHISFEVQDINEFEESLIVQTVVDPNNAIQKKAIDNLLEILREYRHIRYESRRDDVY